ncbi:MAG: S8 family serine peptidase, partial [Dehalococcoidales bacterium]
ASDYTSEVVTGPYPPGKTDNETQYESDIAATGAGARYSVPVNSFEQSILNDPYFPEQWALSRIRVSGLWQLTSGRPETMVAIVDTGIDSNHEELKGKVVAEVNFTSSSTTQDLNGHGTHIAGIVVSSSNNNLGVAGLAPEARLMNVKVADYNGICQADAVAKGIIWAVDNGARVINISLELSQPSLKLEKAVDYAWASGVVVVAAAGNYGGGQPAYPACYENCVAVAATRQDDTLAPLSNNGDWVDVAAPGFNIYSTLPENSYGYKSGTSFATAYVSGLAALLFDIARDTNGNGRLNDEVRAAIEAGCRQACISSVDKGIVDAVGSMAQIGYSSRNLP